MYAWQTAAEEVWNYLLQYEPAACDASLMAGVLSDDFELSSERTRLRLLRSEDAALFSGWLADPEAIKYSLSRFQTPMSDNEVQDWLAGVMSDTSAVSFGIERKDQARLIGYAGVAGINNRNRSGEYFIFIGDRTSWGNGFGTEVTRLVADHAFERLNLHRLQLTVSAPNIGGVKAYGRAGFVVEGVLRDACWRDGEPHHKIAMSILKPEWQEAKEALG